MKTVVLLSGGLDSTTVLAQAIADGAEEVLAVTFTYGSRHSLEELAAAERVAWHYFHLSYNVVHRVIPLPDIFKGGQSALMGDVDVPKETYRDYEAGEGESITVVPFRNANLISAAVTLAEVDQYERIYAGMHASDHGAWAYPDCSPEFLGAMANAIYVGTLHRVRLVFPLIWMTKAEVAARADLLNAPYKLTYSCYRGGPLHCGECPTCIERRLAFEEGIGHDPTEYKVG